MTNLAMWSLILGFFLPIVTSVIIQTGWSQPVQSVAAFLLAVLVGLGNVYFNGDLDFENEQAWISSVLLVVVTSISSYKGFWKPTGVSPAVERVTSPSSGPS